MKTLRPIPLLIALVLTPDTSDAQMAPNWKATTSAILDPAVEDTRNWWELFKDKDLSRLLESLDLSSPQLAGAVQRLEQSRAGVSRARSELFPSLGTSFGGARTQLSQASAAVFPIRMLNQWDAGITASYEVDLWGRVRHGVRSARASVLADEKAVESLRLSLRAEVADAYIMLRGIEAEQIIVEKALLTRTRNVELTQQRKDAGAGSDQDVEQARADLLAAEVEVSALKQARMELENVIALLVGQSASVFRMKETGRLPQVPALPRVIPSELLHRRPDIAQASHQIEAVLGQVQAARTAWLPSLHLRAETGMSAERVRSMDESAAHSGSIGFLFSLPLSDGGRRRADLEATKASHQEAVEQHQQVILAAAAEAESALGKVYWGRKQHEQATASAAAAAKSASLMSSRYAGGGVDTFQNLYAERLRLDAARLKVRAQTVELRAVVVLVRALGGGWNQ